MKHRDELDLDQLREKFAQASEAEQYEVLSAWAWAMRHAHGKAKPKA